MIGITLDDAEITRAIKNHISQMGLDISDKEIDVAFTAGRGTNGNTATVTIREPKDITELVMPSYKKTPATPKADPKPDVDPAEEAVVDTADTDEAALAEEEEVDTPATKKSIFDKPKS